MRMIPVLMVVIVVMAMIVWTMAMGVPVRMVMRMGMGHISVIVNLRLEGTAIADECAYQCEAKSQRTGQYDRSPGGGIKLIT